MSDGQAGAPYAITETIHSSSHAVIHRAIAADGRRVIIKTVPEHYGPQHVERLKNEREMGARLDLPSVVRPLARETLEGRPALVLEDFGGVALGRLLGSPMEVGHFLRLALAIARSVAGIHGKDVVHRDLKPDNILVHPITGEVRIADLGIASTLPGQRPSASVRLIEGSLPYMSPEQTGRTNRALDQRSDLYSLGITFFEMLTGRLPFQAADPLEWVHCHVARRPPSPAALVPSLPPVLAALVLRLLAKEPEDRYQSAQGLARDLERCLGQWEAQARLEDFPIGEDDVVERLQIQQRLYGRGAEITQLLGAFERVVSAGAPELVLVSGSPGIGKSSLVNELQRPIVRERGLFAAGKFDQYKRDIPYATFVQAFTELVLEILAQSAQQIAEWRRALQEALGVNGQLVVDVIPQVALVIGPQPPVPALPPAEAQNRFRLVFRSFIAVFARQEHPLALFLDDLQWADPASLALVGDLVTQAAPSSLCLVGAYRNNEVGPSHRLLLTRDEARATGARVSTIALAPLTRDHLAAFLGDVFHCPPERAAPLAELLEEKTGGNPFFALQFLSALHQERLVEFDRASGAWRWDLAGIRGKRFTDNVVDLMIGKLRRLSPASVEAVQALACLGTTVEVPMLTTAQDLDAEAAHAALAEAVREGFLVRLGDAYAFVHDRIQEAAYSLIPVEQRAAVHLRIGRRLAAGLTPEALEDHLFDVANQLDRGASLISEPAEKETLFRLNLRAGTRAKQNIAYGSARGYLAQAAAALPDGAWQTRYDDVLAVTLARAECAYMVSSFDAADELFAALLENARSRSDRATVCRLRIRRHLLTSEYEKGLAISLEALALFGVTFPDSEAEVRAAFMAEAQAIGPNLAGRRIADLVDAPVITDPDVCATIDLFTDFLPCGYNAGARIFPLVVLKMLNICLKNGSRETACCAYSVSALILSSFFGDIRMAHELSEMSLALNQRLDDPRLRGMLLFIHGGFVSFWRHPFSASPAVFDRALEACLEVGDFVYAAYVGCHAVWHALEGGDPLDEVLALSRRYGTIYRQIRSDITCELLRLYDQFIACLQGKTRANDSFDDDQFSEAACLDLFKKAGAHAGLFIDSLLQAMAHFIYERPDQALAAASQAEALLGANIGSALEPTFHFFHALTLAAAHGSPGQQEQHVRRVQEKLKKLELWATHCPENYRHRQLLVAAELARIEGRPLEAMRLYEEAVGAASQAQIAPVAALAHELAARCARAHGLPWMADHHLREAHDAYLRWGADGKVRQLEAAFPRLRERRPAMSAGTFSAAPEELDLLSVIKASQAISGEIVLDQLLRKLVEIVMAQAGASKGLVILRREQAPNETLAIEAEAVVAEDGTLAVDLLRSLPLSAALLPPSIVNYAWRTRSRVVLENAPDSPRFGADDYIARTRPRSVLCLPILRQAAPVGLLYLENGLVAGAFREEQMAVLELLSAQAAISLEHALLLSKEQAARTEAVEALHLREEFLTVVSHELRTPMTSLSWTLQTLQGHASGTATIPQNAPQLIDLAGRQADRMNRLIRELLEVSRIHSGPLSLERRRVDLGGLVRDTIQRFALDLARAECPITVRGDAPVEGLWDPSRLDQVVENLLCNAMKFGAGKPIEVRITQEARRARIAVTDQGIGIAAGHQEHIFERFGRAVSETNYGGLGLGLYICRRIVHAHGGTISVVSRPGAGATFTVELPCEAVPAP